MPQNFSRIAMFRPYPPGPTKLRRKVAGAFYGKDPRTGKVYFGFVRKVPPKGRTDKHGNHKGAAGTSEEYWGKWCGPGGTPGERCKHPLCALFEEFGDETGYRADYRNVRHVDISGRNQGAEFTVVFYDTLPGVDFFIVEMRWDVFTHVFPSHFEHNSGLIRSSHGEIDSACRLSTQDVFDLQSYEVDQEWNNYFTSYVLKTFFEVTMPFLCKFYPAYGRRWTNVQPPTIMRDTKPRFPRWGHA
jgi:hypothetical protein